MSFHLNDVSHTPKRSMTLACLTALLALTASLSVASATPSRLEERDGALSPESGSWSVGVFNPLKLQLAESWGVELHPLAFFMNPHARVTHSWWRSETQELSGVYGLSLPSLALNGSLPFGAAGYLGPACLVTEVEPERGGCQRGGWGLSPLAGVQYGLRQDKRVISAWLDVAVGVMLSGERPLPLDSHPPIELIFAPLSNSYRVHTGARVAQRLTDRLSASLELHFWWVGEPDLRLSESPKSPWTLSSHAGVDYAFGEHLSGTLGVIYWNSDQRAVVYEDIGDGYQRKTSVRSHDLWPTFDLIWSY